MITQFSRHASSRAALSRAAPIAFVVDNDISFRTSLRQLIHGEGWKSETFGSVREIILRARSPVPTCLILESCPSDARDLEMQQQMARHCPQTPIIVLSNQVDVPTAVQLIKAGAVDLLVKPISNDLMLDAIRRAFERSRAALDHEIESRSLLESYARLSPRERQVMALVVSGLSNKRVGRELNIVEATVKRHRGCAMRKMCADSLAGLVQMAMTLGIAPSATSQSTGADPDRGLRGRPLVREGSGKESNTRWIATLGQ
jgi:FixJ family two-component response regulator